MKTRIEKYGNLDGFKVVSSAGETAYVSKLPKTGDVITLDGPNGSVKRRLVSLEKESGTLHYWGNVE
jgi:hypothetical protein